MKQAFVLLSVLYALVLAGILGAWVLDRRRREAWWQAEHAEGAAVAQREISKLNVQLHQQTEERRALEGYYILDESANLDEEWRDEMAYALRQLEDNDPEGTDS